MPRLHLLSILPKRSCATVQSRVASCTEQQLLPKKSPRNFSIHSLLLLNLPCLSIVPFAHNCLSILKLSSKYSLIPSRAENNRNKCKANPMKDIERRVEKIENSLSISERQVGARVVEIAYITMLLSLAFNQLRRKILLRNDDFKLSFIPPLVTGSTCFRSKNSNKLFFILESRAKNVVSFNSS